MDNDIQRGPLYQCFTCGLPATLRASFAEGARRFRAAGYGPSPLDEWGQHLWYFRKQCQCQPVRVVRLGDCVMPLVPSDPEGLSPTDIPAIRAGLEAIARAVLPEDRCVDPATRIVYSLLAGVMTPDDAVQQIHRLGASRSPVQSRRPVEMILT
jgi:hypothetical protein